MTSVEKVDVLIVGTGPSGTSTALNLVKQDPNWAKRIVMVDKAIHPREKLCGGGITYLGQNVLARLGLTIEPKHFVAREIRFVYQKEKWSFMGNPILRIVRRDEFDHWLIQKAEALGISVRQGETVKQVNPQKEYVEVVTDKGTFHAQVLVAADGSKSFVRRALKWDDESRVARLLEVLTPENPQEHVEFQEGLAIFDFTRMTDGLQGYYWDFPSFVNGQPFMNRGVFDSRAQPIFAKADLKQILTDSMQERARNLEDYKLKGHPIRWWDKRGKFAMDRILLVGDAAGADPLLGEGISFALAYGEVAAPALVEAFAQQDFRFATYKERLLANPIMKQLNTRVFLARIFYLLRWPFLARITWRVANWLTGRSGWHDPNYNPELEPETAVSS